MERFQNKQQGFTLLELLVVITLLAVLAVGALVTYDDVGDKAESAAAANSAVGLDTAVRQFKAVSNNYPNQWDSLVAQDGSLISPLPTKLQSLLGKVSLPAGLNNIARSLGNAGINELQFWEVNDSTAQNPTVLPNLAHNESVNPPDGDGATELEVFEDGNTVAEEPTLDALEHVAALKGRTGCTLAAGTGAATAVFDQTNNEIQNKYNDFLEGDECHLVVALGFGSDAAASTTGASVQLGKAPSYTKTDKNNPGNNVNPNEHYSRFIGLFLVASDGSDNAVIEGGEYLDKARLIALIAPDGTIADENLAAANK